MTKGRTFCLVSVSPGLDSSMCTFEKKTCGTNKRQLIFHGSLKKTVEVSTMMSFTGVSSPILNI